MTGARSWTEMREWIERRLHETTGADLATWRQRTADAGLRTEAELRDWLADRGVTGYGRMLLVMERTGYPDWFLAGADELVDAQYADRPALRPVHDAVLAAALPLGAVHVQARKGYVSLVGPRRTFAVVQAATRRRVDLGLRLQREPAGRLLPARSVGNGSCTVRVALGAVADVDDEVVDLLAEAYAANA